MKAAATAPSRARLRGGLAGIAATLTAFLAPFGTARAADSPPAHGVPSGWSLRIAPQALVSIPSGAFDAPHADPTVHLGGFALVRHGTSPFALRLDAGGATLRTGVSGVEVAWPTPAYQTTLQSLRTGADVEWLAAGAQWCARELEGGPYAFATAGAAQVRPRGDAEVAQGATVDLPGLPPRSTTWRFAAGAGLHFPLDPDARGAVVGELEYAYGGPVDFVAAHGVDGAFPDVRYAARRARIALLTLRFGLQARL